MAAILKSSNPNGSDIASQAIASNTTTAGNQIPLPHRIKEIILQTQCTARTDGTFTPQIDGSFDGSTWINLKQGTAITSVTQNFTSWVVEKDGALPPIIRISILSASVTSGATLNAKVFIG